VQVILTVLDHFLTKDEAFAHFGHQSGATSFAAFLYNRSSSNSRAGTPSTPLNGPASSSTAASSSTTTAARPADRSTPTLAPPTAANDPQPPLIRELEKARAKRDGPSFLASIERYNTTLRALKAAGVVQRNIAAMKGLREKVWTKVFLQCYDRAVGPDIERLKEYEAFSDNVYGELLPKFMNEMCVVSLSLPRSSPRSPESRTDLLPCLAASRRRTSGPTVCLSTSARASATASCKPLSRASPSLALRPLSLRTCPRTDP